MRCERIALPAELHPLIQTCISSFPFYHKQLKNANGKFPAFWLPWYLFQIHPVMECLQCCERMRASALPQQLLFDGGRYNLEKLKDYSFCRNDGKKSFRITCECIKQYAAEHCYDEATGRRFLTKAWKCFLD